MVRRVLEIGVGGGGYALRPMAPCLPSWFCVYCDKEPSPELGVVFCDVEEGLEYPSGFFDDVFMFHVLEHLRDPVSALREVYRVLKPGGRLHVVVPNRLSPNARADPDHKQFFTYWSLRRVVREAGFEVVFPERYNFVFLKCLLRYLSLLFGNEIYLVGVK